MSFLYYYSFILSFLSIYEFIPDKSDFKWEGAGQQLFVGIPKATGEKPATASSAGDEVATGADEEYDPHYEPIVPLPDKIVVTTGEEDEVRLFII